MDNPVIVGAVAAIVGLAIGYFVDRLIKGGAYKTRDEIIRQAERDAENVKKDLELKLKEDMLKRRESLESKMEEVRGSQRERDRELDKRESQLEEQQESIRKKEKMLQSTQQKLAERVKAMEAKDAELNRLLKEEQEVLYKTSELTREQATEQLLKRLDRELTDQTGAMILKHEAEVKIDSERRAREIIGMAVQRYASAHTSESTVSTVDIPSDEVKGRIIGREGRNIRAFEKATGVDVIVDDTPGVVIVSAFDSVRREIGKLSLTKLIQDGRIHPSRIEEIVAET
ncbi:MAG: DUF3552 domain-containing protein, partial [Fuerstia sp.]|nr:DUF3552 domain-containing protein [Fuerstiella sp.]